MARESYTHRPSSLSHIYMLVTATQVHSRVPRGASSQQCGKRVKYAPNSAGKGRNMLVSERTTVQCEAKVSQTPNSSLLTVPREVFE